MPQIATGKKKTGNQVFIIMERGIIGGDVWRDITAVKIYSVMIKSQNF